MNVRTLWWSLGVMSLLALAGPRAAPSHAERHLYANEDLSQARQLYTTNLRGNFYDLVERLDEPLLTIARQVTLQLPDRSSSPLQFYAIPGERKIYVPIESVKFVDDFLTALTWRTSHDCDPSAAFDYAGMLAEPERVASLPSPLPALGVPAGVLSTDTSVYEDSGKLLKSAIYFLLAHELCHVVLGHAGNIAVSPEVSQRQEQAADALALDAMARVGVVPVGMIPYFRAVAYYEGPAGNLGRADYQRLASATSTHPLAASRIQAIAAGLRTRRAEFVRTNPARTVDFVADQIEQIAAFLDDPAIRNFQALRSRGRPLSSLRGCKEWVPGGVP